MVAMCPIVSETPEGPNIASDSTSRWHYGFRVPGVEQYGAYRNTPY